MKTITITIFFLLTCVVAYSQNKAEVKKPSESKVMVKTDNTTKPLIVLDGVTLIQQNINLDLDEELKLEGIEADDIQQIEVLKDKKAIEKYGEEGKNGVIIITTKDPKKYKKK
jgi:TonB-dependent SusC/RagA subfamily outer membrane receptor